MKTKLNAHYLINNINYADCQMRFINSVGVAHYTRRIRIREAVDMPTNIEIKARVKNLELLLEKARSISGLQGKAACLLLASFLLP